MKWNEFIEKQEIMDSLGETLEHLYNADPTFNLDGDLNELTERTYQVMVYVEQTKENLLKDPVVADTAERFGVTIESIADDISEIMTFSTLARQEMALERLLDTKGD